MNTDLQADYPDPGVGGNLPRDQKKNLLRIYLLAFVAGFLLISSLTAYRIRAQYRNAKSSWNLRLYSEVANRAWVLSNWLQEGQDDGQMLASSAAVHALLSPPSRESGLSPRLATGLVNSLIDDFGRIYGYTSIFILDRDSRVTASSSGSTPPTNVLAVGQAALNAGRFRIDLLGKSPETSLLVFSTPVVLGQPANAARTGKAVIGVVILADPLATELIPLVRAELASTRTGETLLLGVKGSEGVYLSPRRLPERESAARDTLKLSIGLASPDRVTQIGRAHV